MPFPYPFSPLNPKNAQLRSAGLVGAGAATATNYGVELHVLDDRPGPQFAAVSPAKWRAVLLRGLMQQQLN
jgi:hypothetical protein